MPHDPSAWLGKIEPEKPRNERLWDGSTGDPAITPPAEIRNAATLDDARRGAGMNPHLAHREDTRAAMVKGREDREQKERPKVPVVAPETPMPKANLNAPTPGNLRTYLLQHGPTDRAKLLDEVGYRRTYKNEATARTMLNKALREIGAVSDTPRGPLWIPNELDGWMPTAKADRDEKPVTRAPYTSPPPDPARAAQKVRDFVDRYKADPPPTLVLKTGEIEPDDADLVNRYELATRALHKAQDAHEAARNALFERLKK